MGGVSRVLKAPRSNYKAKKTHKFTKASIENKAISFIIIFIITIYILIRRLEDVELVLEKSNKCQILTTTLFNIKIGTMK